MTVNILESTAPVQGGSFVDTGQAFITSPMGLTSLDTPVACHSLNDFQTGFNTTRTGTSVPVWDWLDDFFREGGNTAYVVDHGTEQAGTTLGASLTTGGPITSITLTASQQVKAGDIIYLVDGVNTQAFVATAASSSTTVAVASQTPNFAYPLTVTTVTVFHFGSGLASFSPYLGPGQVAIVGETVPNSLAVYTAIQQHCDANNRIGLLDVASTDNTAALMEADGTIAQAMASLENVGLFGSWVNIPAPAGVIGGTSRSVPFSASVAALCNRVDQALTQNGVANYNQPAGGRGFPLQYATGFVFDPVNPNDQSGLFAKGVNFGHNAWGVLENYGFVTPIYQGTPLTSTPFWQLNCSRARMWLKANAAIIGENYYMRDIDGQGKLAGQLQADLMQLLDRLYEAGGLYGDPPGGANPAYDVQVGVGVNSTSTAATGTLNAVASVKFSQYAQTVNITLVSVPVQGQIV